MYPKVKNRDRIGSHAQVRNNTHNSFCRLFASCMKIVCDVCVHVLGAHYSRCQKSHVMQWLVSNRAIVLDEFPQESVSILSGLKKELLKDG